MSEHATRFWINSGGEYGHDDANHNAVGEYGGCINISSLSEQEIQQAFAQQRLDICQNVAELALLDEYDRLSIDNGRWRVYGSIDYTNLTRAIVLSTEFVHDKTDSKWWAGVHDAARNANGTVEEMWEDTERGYWKTAEMPENFRDLSDEEKRAHPSYVPSENEGMVTLQVAVNFEIAGKSVEERDALIERFENATQRLWAQAGVNVM